MGTGLEPAGYKEAHRSAGLEVGRQQEGCNHTFRKTELARGYRFRILDSTRNSSRQVSCKTGRDLNWGTKPGPGTEVHIRASRMTMYLS